MKNTCLTLLAPIFFLISSCTGGSEEASDWSEFYTPYRQLGDADLLLEYSYIDSEDAPFYWYLSLDTCENGRDCLMSQQLDVSGEIQLESRELILDEGVILKEQRIIEIDTLSEQRFSTDVAIMADDLFSFLPLGQDQQLAYEITFQSSVYSGQKTSISRKRQFIGDTTVIFEGKRYPALRFKLREYIDIEEVGHLELELEGEETYAKNIGLVHSVKRLAEGTKIEYYLTKYEYIDKTN